MFFSFFVIFGFAEGKYEYYVDLFEDWGIDVVGVDYKDNNQNFSDSTVFEEIFGISVFDDFLNDKDSSVIASDNHLLLVDLTNKDITGKEAEEILESAGLTVNKNAIPFDTQSRFVTGGIRIGTPAVTSRW